MNLKRLFGLEKNQKIDSEAKGINDSIKLKELSRVPLADRNLEWDHNYMKYAAEAHLACKIPQVDKSENGFTYFQLEIPDVGKPFQAYTIAKLIKEHLIADGIGVSVSSYDEKPDVLLSYGELLNYHLRKSFRSNIKNWITPSPTQFDGQLEIMGGNPSELILPRETRRIMLDYFVKNNIHFPKVSFLNVMTSDGLKNQLVFNIIPAQFNSERHFQTFLSSLSWFLPVHYTYTSIPDEYLGDLFFDLYTAHV